MDAGERSRRRRAVSRAVFDTLESRKLLAATLPEGFAEALVVGGLTSPTSMDFAPDGRQRSSLKAAR